MSRRTKVPTVYQIASHWQLVCFVWLFVKPMLTDLGIKEQFEFEFPKMSVERT
eukprot:m.246905 g.246905  ORF g.246905 m.246905 type:complete len:53 (+) comp40263_c0_seq3:2159-2317(+)